MTKVNQEASQEIKKKYLYKNISNFFARFNLRKIQLFNAISLLSLKKPTKYCRSVHNDRRQLNSKS